MITVRTLVAIIAALLMLFGSALLFLNILHFHQGEHYTLAGKFMLGCGWIAVISALIAALFIGLNFKFARYMVIVSIIFASPLTIFAINQEAWCAFVLCSAPNSDEPLDWFGIRLLAPFVISELLMRLVDRK